MFLLVKAKKVCCTGTMQQTFLTFILLPQADDLDDALGLIAGQLQMVLQRHGCAVPVLGQGGIQDLQVLLTSICALPTTASPA